MIPFIPKRWCILTERENHCQTTRKPLVPPTIPLSAHHAIFFHVNWLATYSLIIPNMWAIDQAKPLSHVNHPVLWRSSWICWSQTWGSTSRFLQTNLNMRSIMHAFAPTTLVVGNTFCSLFPPLVLSWVIFVVSSVCTKVHLFPRGLINVLPRNCQECCALCWCGGENVNSKWTSIWRYEVIVSWQLECSPFPWARSLCRGIFTTCD